jgi:hypothetical protein
MSVDMPNGATESPDDRCRRILQRAMEDSLAEYAASKQTRTRHLVARLRQCFDKYVNEALLKFQDVEGFDAIPVLIGKHFSWVLIHVAANHSIDPSQFLSLIIGNNPERPLSGTAFMNTYGTILRAMEQDLEQVFARLQGQQGAIDYIAWTHEMQDARGRESVSIFGPDDIREAGGDWELLKALTRTRIAALTQS